MCFMIQRVYCTSSSSFLIKNFLDSTRLADTKLLYVFPPFYVFFLLILNFGYFLNNVKRIRGQIVTDEVYINIRT